MWIVCHFLWIMQEQETINTLRCRWSKINNKSQLSKLAEGVESEKMLTWGRQSVKKVFAERFHEGESVDTENSSSFDGNGNKNMRAEQICILCSLQVLSFGCNPDSLVPMPRLPNRLAWTCANFSQIFGKPLYLRFIYVLHWRQQ